MNKQEFSERLSTLRINKGVSARDMSLSIGQSPGYINNIENGINYRYRYCQSYKGQRAD